MLPKKCVGHLGFFFRGTIGGGGKTAKNAVKAN